MSKQTERPARGEVERRSYPLRELRIEPAGKQRKVIGYAAIFDVLSEPLWGFREKIRKGAFAKTIRTADVRALFNHDENYVLGRSKAGTLKLWEDNTGLGIEILAPDTTWARDLLVTIDRGDVDQMSFSFKVVREEWSGAKGPGPAPEEIRTLIEVELRDVSVVVFPAYLPTIAQVRGTVFGVDTPRLVDALCSLEDGCCVDSERRMLERVVARAQARLPNSRRQQLDDALHPDLARRRRELELIEREVASVVVSRCEIVRRHRGGSK